MCGVRLEQLEPAGKARASGAKRRRCRQCMNRTDRTNGLIPVLLCNCHTLLSIDPAYRTSRNWLAVSAMLWDKYEDHPYVTDVEVPKIQANLLSQTTQ